MPSGLLQYLRKVLFLVGTDRRRLVWLLPLFLVSSIADLFGIGVLVALITTLKSTEAAVEFASGIPLLDGYASAASINALLLLLSGLVLLVYALKTAIAFYANRLTLELSFRYGARLRTFLMRVYQGQSYARYILRNSSDYVYNIQTMAGRIVSSAVQPLLRIVGDGLVVLLIMFYLAAEDPFVLAFLVVLVLITGTLYDRAFRKKMAVYGSQENNISAEMIRYVTEGLNGYRESHIFGIVDFFHRAVEKSARALASARIRSQLITTSSRFLLEFIVVLSVVLFVVAAIIIGRDKGDLLSTLALFLVASMRLVPAANQIVTNVGRLRHGRHAIDVLYSDIRELAGETEVEFEPRYGSSSAGEDEADLGDFRSLRLQEMFFRYRPDDPWVLESVKLDIERHDIVGIAGSSGSGKSTMIALMLGFLLPQRGSVSCNGQSLADPAVARAWHRKVAYLPQEVFLTDDTVARNIALGVNDEDIDRERLAMAIRKARLSGMVAKMPKGMDSAIGENGLRVSGGQRQRIALARAFYYDAEVLIMDESTSALDAKTSDEIISELRHLKGRVTVILITHQDALLGLCDKVLRLEGGQLSALRV